MSLRPGGVPQGKIDRTRSYWQYLKEYPLAAVNNYAQEGDAFVLSADAGVNSSVVSRSAGVANEKFIGIAISDYLRLTDFVNVESCVVPHAAPFTFQMSKSTPVAGTIFIQDSAGTVMTDVSPGVPAALNQYSVSATGLVTFFAAKADAIISQIRYTYLPTNVEVISRFHQRPFVAQGQTALGQVALATGRCEIYTTQYNTANTWTINARAYTGAAGKFTTTNTAVQVAGIVISVPSISDPFLGLLINSVPGAMTW